MIVIAATRTVTKELEEGKQAEAVITDVTREEEQFSEGEDRSWYLGKAKEEFRRGRKGGSSRGEEDPIQVRVSLNWLIGMLPICRFSGQGIDEMQSVNGKLILGRKTTSKGVYGRETAKIS
jgi:hypothetical protein